jgi:hypothetical protein
MALLKGGGRVAPRLLSKLGRTTEGRAMKDTQKVLEQAGGKLKTGTELQNADFLRDVVTGLVGAEVFSGFLNSRPGTRETLIEKAFGKIPQAQLDQFRQLKALGMPIDGDPRAGMRVIETGQRGAFLRQRLGLE